MDDVDATIATPPNCTLIFKFVRFVQTHIIAVRYIESPSEFEQTAKDVHFFFFPNRPDTKIWSHINYQEVSSSSTRRQQCTSSHFIMIICLFVLGGLTLVRANLA